MLATLRHTLAGESDFVNKVNYYRTPPAPGKPRSKFTPEDSRMHALLQEIIDKCARTEYVTHITETIHLTFKDIPDLAFTIVVGAGQEITLTPQIDPTQKATLSLELFRYNLERFREWLDQDTFTEEQLHMIVHTLAFPAVQSFYRSDLVNKLKHIRFLKLHKLLHLQLANPAGYEYEGVSLEGKVTVLNSLGQFFVFEGHHGVAPVIYTFTARQAISFYDLLKYELPRAKSLSEKKKLFDEYMQMREEMSQPNPRFAHPDNH